MLGALVSAGEALQERCVEARRQVLLVAIEPSNRGGLCGRIVSAVAGVGSRSRVDRLCCCSYGCEMQEVSRHCRISRGLLGVVTRLTPAAVTTQSRINLFFWDRWII